MAARRKKSDAVEIEPVRYVDGLEVVSSEPVPSGLNSAYPDRPPVTFRFNRLVLSDDSERYGCADCDYTAERVNTVRSHRSRVHPNTARMRKREGISAELSALTVAELIVLAEAALVMDARFAELEESLAGWRSRAVDAEREVNRYRTALGRLVQIDQ